MVFQCRTKQKEKKVLHFKPKEEYFIKHGNILLKKRIALTQGQTIGTGQLKIISAKEIEGVISNCEPESTFSESGWLVYKATLEGRVCMIWVSPQQRGVNPELTDCVLTGLSTRMAMNHGNIFKVYGCCLETCIPIAVYDFWPKNLTLFQHLHGNAAVNKHLNWEFRLRIAADVSYALSYMHNALPKPVVHRGIQSFPIALDDSFHAKLGNLGFSMVIEPGESSHRWPVVGVPGYIDPEYIETQVVTVKCDVYSFGVLMLELLTGMNPIALSKRGSDLVKEFVVAVEQKCMVKMIDKEVMAQANCSELEQFAKLALTCVASKGEDRPTMIEVVSTLWKVQGIHNN